MKSLQDYIEEAQTKAFYDNGAFFAFGKDQFDKAKREGVKYIGLGYGLICPTDNASQLMEDLEMISKEGIKQDIQENGIEAIIERELANHEVQITRDISDTVSALDGYDITEEQIRAVYKKGRLV